MFSCQHAHLANTAAQAQPERAFKLWAAQNGKSYENDEVGLTA